VNPVPAVLATDPASDRFAPEVLGSPFIGAMADGD